MIITPFQSIKTEAIATERSIKSLLGLLSQEGEVEPSPKRLRFLTNVSELSVQPFLHLRRDHMKGILHPLPKTKRPLPTTQQPSPSQLMKAAPLDP
jgi:hypothetical protein